MQQSVDGEHKNYYLDEEASERFRQQDSPVASGISSSAALAFDVDGSRLGQNTDGSQLRRTRSKQLSTPIVQLPHSNNERFFSMRSQVKVSKFLRKADKALIKLFKLPENSESIIDQLLEGDQVADDEPHQ